MTTEQTDRAEAVAGKLQELGLSLHPGIRYELDSLFPKIEGWGAKKAIKEKHRLLKRVEPVLETMLREGEEVLYVAHGTQYKLLEQYFLGLWAGLINQTVFVLTNARLLMLHTDSKGRPRKTFWSIYYSQIEKFQATWHGTVRVVLRDGTKLKFSSFPKRDRKQMPAIFERCLDAYRQRGFDPEVTQSRENLCSFCFERVPKNEYTCPACGAEFWTPRAVAARSLVFPSWGDFLMGHTGLAIVELLGYTLFWVFMIVGVLAEPGGPNPATLAVTIVVAFLIVHAPDAWLTLYIAKKGLTPKQGPQTVPAEDDVGPQAEPGGAIDTAEA